MTENANQQQPAWNGLMADYSVVLTNPYVSTLAAGLIGVGLVVAASYALDATMTNKKRQQTAKPV